MVSRQPERERGRGPASGLRPAQSNGRAWPKVRCSGWSGWSTDRGTAMEYRTLETLRRRHPAWRLLNADHAPLIVSFLHDTFIRPNVRTLSRGELETRLEDYLFALRADLGENMFPREAGHY